MSAPDRPTHEALTQTAARALAALKGLQREDGHWCAVFEGDSFMQSEYLLMMWILGHER